MALPHEIPEHALRVGQGESPLLDQCRRQDLPNSHGQTSALTEMRAEQSGAPREPGIVAQTLKWCYCASLGRACLSQCSAVFACAAPVLRGGVSHEFHRELAPFGVAKEARMFNSACARAVFADVGRVRFLQRVRAGTFVGEGMNTLCLTGLATRNKAPVGTMLGGLGGVSKCHCHLIARQSPRD